jgi:hypothetical protein
VNYSIGKFQVVNTENRVGLDAELKLDLNDFNKA